MPINVVFRYRSAARNPYVLPLRAQQLPHDRCNMIPLMREVRQSTRLLQGHNDPRVDTIIVEPSCDPFCKEVLSVSFIAASTRPEILVEVEQDGKQDEGEKLNLPFSFLTCRESFGVRVEGGFAPMVCECEAPTALQHHCTESKVEWEQQSLHQQPIPVWDDVVRDGGDWSRRSST